MMYSKEEVEDIIYQMKDTITSNMSNEIRYYLNMNGKTNIFQLFFPIIMK